MLQELAKKCPYNLRNNTDLKNDFFELASRILTFVPNSDDNRIGPKMMRTFSRIRPAQKAVIEYRQNIKQTLENGSITYRIIG